MHNRMIVADRSPMMFRVLAATCAGLALGLAPGSSTQAQEVILPTIGCPKAHCTKENFDYDHLKPPLSTSPAVPEIVWEHEDRAGEKEGSKSGLGCSANGTIAVCSYNADVPFGNYLDNVIAYDYDGNMKWRSGNLLNATAFSSAPLILESGANPEVIAADNATIIRFKVEPPGYGYVWKKTHASGQPVSPVITDNGVVILAMIGGPIAAFDWESGNPLVTKTLLAADLGVQDAEGYFETHKTVAVSGNRIYIVMQLMAAPGQIHDDHIARLVALDVDPDATSPGDRLRVVSYYPDPAQPPASDDDFTTGTEGSKSSPSVMQMEGDDCVFFDGWRRTAPNTEDIRIFAVCDVADTLTEEWVEPTIDGPTFASFAESPSGDAFWYASSDSPVISKMGTDGEPLVDGDIDVDVLIGDTVEHRPSSAMSITGSPGDPIMLVAATGAPVTTNTWVLAVHLNDGSLEWKVPVPAFEDEAVVPEGQFPIVRKITGPVSNTRVVFTALGPGVRAIGLP